MAEPATDVELDYFRDCLLGPYRTYAVWSDISLAKLVARIDAERAAREKAEAAPIARPLDEWHEDFGPVLWWKFPIEEPPYVGSPLDADWPDYHTHWTPIRCPEQPQIALKEPSNG